MAYQALCDFSSSHTFQMGQLMGKVVIQEKIFPNKLFQVPTITKDKNNEHTCVVDENAPTSTCSCTPQGSME